MTVYVRVNTSASELGSPDLTDAGLESSSRWGKSLGRVADGRLPAMIRWSRGGVSTCES